MSSRVVITGLGPVSPSGSKLEDFEANIFGTRAASFEPVWVEEQAAETGIVDADSPIKELRSGLRHLNKLHTNSDLPNIRPGDPLIYKLALVAGTTAMNEAGQEQRRLDDEAGENASLIFGGGQPPEAILKLKNDFDEGQIITRAGSTSTHGARAAALARLFNIQGFVQETASACSSALDAIIQGFKLIKHGGSSLSLCGGIDTLVDPMILQFFKQSTLLATAKDSLGTACRPFCQDSDGASLSNGGGLVRLEALEQADKEKILAEVVGAASSFDAQYALKPNVKGMVRAINKALQEANIEAGDIDFIQLHATGTSHNDQAEAKVLREVFADHLPKIKITANKSRVGHMMGGSGFQGLAELALGLARDKVPVTQVNSKLDSELCRDLHFTINDTEDFKGRYGMALSMGFGGYNSCVILKKFQD